MPTVCPASSAEVIPENEGEAALVQIARFDQLPAVQAADLLRPCCASGRWSRELISGRPYGSVRRILSASDDIVAGLSWADVSQALAAHPRIGDRAGGADQESAWSRQEQSGAAESSVAELLRQGNIAYEQRFGHVFLICATGRSAAEMLAELNQRLGNDTAVEHEVVRTELGAIVRLRLIKTFH